MPLPASSLRSLRFLLFPLCLVVLTTSALAQPANDAAAKAAVVAPFLDEQTLVVARVDLRQIDPAEVVKALGKIAPPNDSDFTKQLTTLEQRSKQLLSALTQLDVRELYAVISLADMPKEPLFIVAPVKAGGNSEQTAAGLRQLLHFEASDVRPGAVVLGKTSTIERLKALRPAPRPELARGFERTGDAAVQIVAAPSDDTRRVIREMLPRLPDEVGGGSGKMLADGVQWATVSIQAPPRLALSVVIQSRDAEAATALRGTIVSALQVLARAPEVRKQWPEVDDFARLLTPRLSGEQLLLSISEREQTELALRLLTAPLQAARTAAGRSQSMNNLKQIGLAMHNYHDTHRRFPAQAIRGKDGRALLSWRVAILPFLDADALYKEFRLDEPWDSEHNRKLVERMPAALAAPGLGEERRAKGLTSYLVPLTRTPPAVAHLNAEGAKTLIPPGKDETVFDPVQGTKFAQIFDGSSNTILVLEAHPKAAVIWTKPDDLVIDPSDLLKVLRGQPDDGFNAVFCDGHAQFIRTTIDPKTFLHLLQMNDGNPVGEY
jgi:prepilin-type processing-associated H-X9-DG protein